MPGLVKNDVEVKFEGITMLIKGDGEDDDKYGRRYCCVLGVPKEEFNFNLWGHERDMKNGVVKLVVPKAKNPQGADVSLVNRPHAIKIAITDNR